MIVLVVPLSFVSHAVAMPFVDHPKLLLVLVMIGCPLCMNIAQLWIQDQFLKGHDLMEEITEEEDSVDPTDKAAAAAVPSSALGPFCTLKSKLFRTQDSTTTTTTGDGDNMSFTKFTNPTQEGMESVDPTQDQDISPSSAGTGSDFNEPGTPKAMFKSMGRSVDDEHAGYAAWSSVDSEQTSYSGTFDQEETAKREAPP